MTIGGRGHLGNEFGGSTRELSPRKKKANTLLDLKQARSEISLDCIKDEQSRGKISSSFLNLIGIPFNWRSRQMANKSESKDKKKTTNMLTNLFKKKRIMCNKRWVNVFQLNYSNLRFPLNDKIVDKHRGSAQSVWSHFRLDAKRKF